MFPKYSYDIYTEIIIIIICMMKPSRGAKGELKFTETWKSASFLSTAPQLRTWLAGMLDVKYVLGSQEAISEAGRLGGCRL